MQNPQTPAADWRDGFFAEYFMEKSSRSFPSWQMFRDGDWKYIHYPNLRDANELYDLCSDPHEMHNRILEPDFASLVKKLKRRLDIRAAELGKARSNDY